MSGLRGGLASAAPAVIWMGLYALEGASDSVAGLNCGSGTLSRCQGGVVDIRRVDFGAATWVRSIHLAIERTRVMPCIRVAIRYNDYIPPGPSGAGFTIATSLLASSGASPAMEAATK